MDSARYTAESQMGRASSNPAPCTRWYISVNQRQPVPSVIWYCWAMGTKSRHCRRIRVAPDGLQNRSIRFRQCLHPSSGWPLGTQASRNVGKPEFACPLHPVRLQILTEGLKIWTGLSTFRHFSYCTFVKSEPYSVRSGLGWRFTTRPFVNVRIQC